MTSWKNILIVAVVVVVVIGVTSRVSFIRSMIYGPLVPTALAAKK